MIRMIFERTGGVILSFKGFKLKHKLIVKYTVQDSSNSSSVLVKALELTLFISSLKSGMIRFDQMETVIRETLEKYSENELTLISPFDQLKPTLENMGVVFCQVIRQNLARIDAHLEVLEISESPIKTFIVNTVDTNEKLFIGDKKVKISSLLVENIISQSISHLIAEIEK
jgi:6-pyruvoyltetrahydropterin/6-carboxytetrahydropterin synthase